MKERQITLENTSQAFLLFGSLDSNISILEEAFSVTVTQHENIIKINGSDVNTKKCERAISQLLNMINRGETVTEQTIDYVVSLVNSDNESFMKTIIDSNCVCISAKGVPIKPKTQGQKKYLDAINANTITIGVGPAGTGKTYLAVAAAVTAYRNKDVSRIILTRPAVEAGEKLGFLPGDLQQKIDPTLDRFMTLFLICWALRPLQSVRNAEILR